MMMMTIQSRQRRGLKISMCNALPFCLYGSVGDGHFMIDVQLHSVVITGKHKSDESDMPIS